MKNCLAYGKVGYKDGQGEYGIGGHASSPRIPGIYHSQGIDHIKMADGLDVKQETAGKAEGRSTLLPMRYT